MPETLASWASLSTYIDIHGRYIDAKRARLRTGIGGLERWHDLILRYAAGDTSVKQARDWLEAQVWREVEVLRQVEAEERMADPVEG